MYRSYARHVAQKHGIDPDTFARQIQQESAFNPRARSSAGARGIAQFMPGTAAGLGINPDNPREALDGAAKLMASYVRKYGSYRNALIAYNAGPGAVGGHLPGETRNYIAKILHGEPQGVPAPGRTGAQRGGTAARRIRVPGQTVTDTQAFAYSALTSGSKNPLLFAMAQARAGNFDKRIPGRTYHVPGTKGVRERATGGGATGTPGNVHVAAGANRKGHGLQPVLTDFLGRVAGQAGHSLTIGTGTNHNMMTTSGNISDHWDGHGADIPASGAALTRLGQNALIAAGMNPRKARQQKGGAYTLIRNGRRIQIIFNSNVGGNHYNHLHTGVR